MPALRRHLPALLTTIVLSAWFMFVYGTANHLASLNPDVGTWRYDWEKYIPLVPWMIVPYMSIDLFFVAAPFLCDSREERMALAKRIFFAITVAGVFFILMPLKLAIPRPAVEGMFGPLFKMLHGFDQPYNMLPSLHITLRTILANTFARHTAKHWRVASGVWFSLIGFSTLLVHQHHVVDVVAGFMLAILCFYLFPERPLLREVTPNRRVGFLYLAGAIVCAALAFAWPWWSLWLLWPTLSLAIAAGGYFFLGPAIYRKQDGRIPLPARIVMAPVLFGQRLSLRHYAKKSNAYDRLSDRLIIGRRLNDREAAAVIADHDVRAVVDLTGEFSAARPFLKLPYCNVQISDLTAPTAEQRARCLTFIAEQVSHGTIYIHCKAGYSRTAAIAGAALLAADSTLSVDAAIARLHEARPGIVVRREVAAFLAADKRR